MGADAPVRLLVNPKAGRGRALRRLAAARLALARVGPFDVVETRAAGDEARLAREAAHDGVRALVVLGGDGTVSRVAGALVHAGADTPLAIFAAGTGNDFAKSLRAPVHDYAAMAARIASGHTRRVDVGLVNEQPFVNAAGFGFDVAVLDRSARARWLRGDALYVAAALAELFRFGGFEARLEAGAAHGGARSDYLMIVAANGQWFGGSFRIAPQAALDDGQLDLVLVSDANAWRRARLFAAAPWGGHVSAREVHTERTPCAELSFPAPPRFEVDGECLDATTPRLSLGVRAGALCCVV